VPKQRAGTTVRLDLAKSTAATSGHNTEPEPQADYFCSVVPAPTVISSVPTQCAEYRSVPTATDRLSLEQGSAR